MPSPIAPLLAITLAFAALGSQSSPQDSVEQTRARLEAERREMLASIQDPAWMREQSRATTIRLSIERDWRECAANEAAALARASEKPARLLAEAALAACRAWEQALDLAFQSGANPYLNGRVSREDMVTLAELGSRDAALARILQWRGLSPDSAQTAGMAPREKREGGRPSTAMLHPSPAEAITDPPLAAADAEKPPSADEPVITVVGQRRGGCRVRLAERMLSDDELAARAKQWAATETTLRVIRPAGADYTCLARIVWHLGKYGVRRFQFVESSGAGTATAP